MEASISLKKVGKVLGGRSVLAGLTFGIERGSLMALVGPNDAGKSTLLRILAGTARPEFGTVFINGLDTRLRRNETRRTVGYMPQSPNFDPQMTLEENLRFHACLYGLSTSESKKQIGKLARMLHITEALGEFPASLSRGYLKRGMLARTLVHDPPVLLLDEPTGSLDAQSRYIVWEYLQSLRGKKTIVYATQSIDEAERIHDRIVIMDKGKIVLDGTLERLLENAGELFHFQVRFEALSDELFQRLSKITTLVNPSRMGQMFDFYGRERKVLIDVIKLSADSGLLDYRTDDIGLEMLVLTSTERKRE
ncbi:MAG: ABC transporter ATP-binding protein [Fidelibacterota bacterium]